jgi:predicted DNA-binding transcriptional regulator AlpA
MGKKPHALKLHGSGRSAAVTARESLPTIQELMDHPCELILSMKQVCLVLDLSETSVHKLRRSGQFPRPLLVNGQERLPRWRARDIRDLISLWYRGGQWSEKQGDESNGTFFRIAAEG